MKPEIFTDENLMDIFNKIYREGMKNSFAGDMWEPSVRIEDLTKAVNEIIQHEVESWPMVYGMVEPKVWCEAKGHFKSTHITHVGRIAFIEELPKEPCKHEPARRYDKLSGTYYHISEPPECKHCGVELAATWTEVKK